MTTAVAPTYLELVDMLHQAHGMMEYRHSAKDHQHPAEIASCKRCQFHNRVQAAVHQAAASPVAPAIPVEPVHRGLCVTSLDVEAPATHFAAFQGSGIVSRAAQDAPKVTATIEFYLRSEDYAVLRNPNMGSPADVSTVLYTIGDFIQQQRASYALPPGKD